MRGLGVGRWFVACVLEVFGTLLQCNMMAAALFWWAKETKTKTKQYVECVVHSEANKQAGGVPRSGDRGSFS